MNNCHREACQELISINTAPAIARTTVTALIQVCSFSLSTMCSPTNTSTRNTSLMIRTLVTLFSESAVFKARLDRVPKIHARNITRQSSLNILLILLNAFGANMNVNVVAGKKSAKKVRLTALYPEDSRYLKSITIAALTTVITKTSVIPLTDSGRLKLWIINQPARIARSVPASFSQLNGSLRNNKLKINTQTSLSFKRELSSDTSMSPVALKNSMLLPTISSPTKAERSQRPGCEGAFGDASINGSDTKDPIRQ